MVTGVFPFSPPVHACLHFLLRTGFSIPTKCRFFMLVESHRFLLFHALMLFPLPIVICVCFFYPRKSPYGHEYALLIQLSVLRRIGTRNIDSILIGATFTYFSTEDACVHLFRITTRPWRIRLDDHRTPDNNSSMYQDGLLLDRCCDHYHTTL